MNKFLRLTIGLLLCIVHLQTYAQNPNLPVKGDLATALSATKTFNKPTGQRDIITLPFSPAGDYSIDVKAKVTSATGRGLDVDTRAPNGNGFRTSLTPGKFNFTSPLATPQILSNSDNSQIQNFRYAIKGNEVHIYQNGYYLTSQDLSVSKDVDDNNLEVDAAGAKGVTLTTNWSNTNGKPTDIGWAAVSGTVTWANTNATTAGSVRFLTVSETSNKHTLNGATYNGRVMFIRWDNDVIKDAVYSYPVTLEAGKTYDMSLLYAFWANSKNNSRSITVGISKNNDGTNTLASKTFSPPGTSGLLNRGNFTFSTSDAGQYYITFKAEWGLYSIGELSLNALTVSPRLILGKNYLTGAENMQLLSVTYENGAFAPEISASGSRQTATLSGSKVDVPVSFDTDFIVPGKTDVRLKGDPTPFYNSSVSLNNPDAWLFIENVKPSEVNSNWLSSIKINGQPASTANARVAMYVNGTVVMPYNNNDQTPATFYTGENYSGDTKTFETFTIHNNLGLLDNKFKSFKLKRGYMATIGSNIDGIGFSKVYIADMADIEVPIMPKGLYEKTSFIRVFRWDYVSKKGWAGGNPEIVNNTWHYDWNVGGTSTASSQYVPIRQNAYWPDFNAIYNKTNTNTLLGFNEPDRPDQSNMTVDQAIQLWPQLMKSGFRLGSPAPSAPGNGSNWLGRFMNKIDSLNYRVDFAAIHAYWESRVSGGRADAWNSGLTSAYNNNTNKRPLWITEWNNGANWTSETWPTDVNAQKAKQASDIKLILQVMDTLSVVERYSIYNWVQDKRAMILNGALTPAGEVYAANKSRLAYTSDPTVYKPASIYNHQWRVSAPIIRSTLSSDFTKVNINWLDINGDLGIKYVLERKLSTESSFTPLTELNLQTDYGEGTNLSFQDNLNYSAASYRLYAIGYDNSQSWYSAVLVVKKDDGAAASTLAGQVISSDIINLSWNAATNARAYRLTRSSSPTGTFNVIADFYSGTSFSDQGLTPGTTYYYKVVGLNSAGEGAASNTLTISTNNLVVPPAVSGFYVASGDTQATLTWDFMYDAKYKILRSTSQSGTYVEVASSVTDTRYVDPGLQNGSTYYYRIVAFNNSGDSPQSTALISKPKLGQYLHLSFDENTGTIAYDEWGGFHADLKNAATWTAITQSNTGGVNLVKGSSSFLELSDGVVKNLNDFTIASWIRLPANQGNNTRVFDFGNNTGNYMMLVPRHDGSKIRYKITYTGGNYDLIVPYQIPLDQWTHLVISQQGSTFKMYVNGQLIKTDNTTTVKPSDLGITTKNYIGRSQWPSDPYSDHTYDDFRIYNNALSDAQVQALWGGTTLPVELVTYEAKLLSNRQVELKWSTNQEPRNDRFELYRSTDGKKFTWINTTKTLGDKANNYIFYDRQPQQGFNYYQLKQIDVNGDMKELGVKQVRLSLSNDAVTIFPNPVNELLKIYAPNLTGLQEIVIYDLLGRLVVKTSSTFDESGTVQIGVQNINPGTYILKLNGESYKMLKQ